jgi:D-inositol-3-phosphate glycosyltransferase
MKEKCAELAGRDVPTELIIHGVRTDRFRPGYEQAAREWRRKLNIPGNAAVLLSIRGWSPTYRQEAILEAFARALPRLRAEAILVFKILKRGGADPALYESRMRALAETLGVSHVVRWMDQVPLDQLPAIYSFANVIVNYPYMDAFPVTFLEAAACECPVITCRLPAYAGTFAEEYFHLVSAEDVSELSGALVHFVNHHRLQDTRRRAELRQIIMRTYDERLGARQLMAIYRKFSPASFAIEA